MRRVVIVSATVVLGLSAPACVKKKRKGGDGKGGTVEPVDTSARGIWARDYRRAPIRLPTSRSATDPMVDAVWIAVTRKDVRLGGKPLAGLELNGGRVPASAKRDGPDGFFLRPLFIAIKAWVRQRRAAARRGRSRFTGDAVLAVDQRTPYRTLAEVLYTAAQAELRRFQILVRRPGGELGALLFEMPTLGRARPLGAQKLRVAAIARADGSAAAPRVAARIRGYRLSVVPSGGPNLVATTLESVSVAKTIDGLRGLAGGDITGGVGNAGGGGADSGVPKASTGAGADPPDPATPYACVMRQWTPTALVGLRVAIDPKGRVARFATSGASPAQLAFCIKPWLATWRFAPADKGEYTLSVGVGEGRRPAPAPAKLAPLGAVRPLADKPLGLKVIITTKGFYVGSRYGSECPKSTSPDSRLCFSTGSSNPAFRVAVTQLRAHVASLYGRKYAAGHFWGFESKRRAQIRILADGAVPVGRVVAVLDAVRDAPGTARCRFVFDRVRRRWSLPEPARAGCRYARPVLVISGS